LEELATVVSSLRNSSLSIGPRARPNMGYQLFMHYLSTMVRKAPSTRTFQNL